jgi:hypothetical protein
MSKIINEASRNAEQKSTPTSSMTHVAADKIGKIFV